MNYPTCYPTYHLATTILLVIRTISQWGHPALGMEVMGQTYCANECAVCVRKSTYPINSSLIICFNDEHYHESLFFCGVPNMFRQIQHDDPLRTNQIAVKPLRSHSKAV